MAVCQIPLTWEVVDCDIYTADPFDEEEEGEEGEDDEDGMSAGNLAIVIPV